MKTVYETQMDNINQVEALFPMFKNLINAAEKDGTLESLFNIYVGTHGAVQFMIKTIKELSLASSIIRSVLPEYSYSLSQVWNGYGEALVAQWGDINYPFVIIRLESTIETWPKELTKGDGCKWVANEVTEKRYSLVCEMPGND